MQFRIEAIKPYEINQLSQIAPVQNSETVDLVKQNPDVIKNVHITMTRGEFAHLMKNRPLIRFRPFKNSFVKQGDTILLAEALNIPVPQVKSAISEIIGSNFEIKSSRTKDDIAKVKAYVYRHGAKDEVLAFLKNELSDVKFVLQNLYQTLDDNTGGLSEYFQRPCHRMSNKTLVDIHNIINDSLDSAVNSGDITSSQANESSQWALERIYQIQNDSRVIRAAKIVYNND